MADAELTPLPKQAILIVNTMSRSGAEAFEEAQAKLLAAGVELIDAYAIHKPEEMGVKIEDAVSRAPMVIIGGGDGSLSTNVGYFVGRDTVFAILPLGTANSFAGTLGIAKEIDAAVEVIVSGMCKSIDLGCINGRYFLNSAAIGLSPMIAQTVPHKLKRYLGVIGYLIWAIWQAFGFRPFRVKVVYADGRKEKLWATEVRIANGTHHGGVELIESQTLDSGEIVVQAVTGKSVLRLAWSWFATVFKLRARHGTVREFHDCKLRLETRPRLKVSVDGEVSAKTPIEISIVSRAINVAAPITHKATL
ncbi:MAG: YegS/Rv2252/BmrU family lipid kinase [Sphingorhabdus sp.]